MKHVWIGVLIVTIMVLAAGAASARTMGPGSRGGCQSAAPAVILGGPGLMEILSSAEFSDPSPWFRSGRDQRPPLQRAGISLDMGDARS